MAVQASATQVVDGYTIIASYNPRQDRIDYVINKPDGTELLSAGSSAGVTGGLSTLAQRAENAGNVELANTLRSLIRYNLRLLLNHYLLQQKTKLLQIILLEKLTVIVVQIKKVKLNQILTHLVICPTVQSPLTVPNQRK